MKFTLDTYAWIEYFEGSSIGAGVKVVIEQEDCELFTPSVVLAELSDAVVKGKIKQDWQDLARFVTFNTQIQEIDAELARDAGIIKNDLRKKHPDFGLIDAIVLATARKTNSKLLTGDAHLVGEPNVIDIRKNHIV